MLRYILFILTLSFFFPAAAQNCPPNTDFSTGTFDYWQYFEGTYIGSGTLPGVLVDTMQVYPASAQTLKRFTITSGTDTDFYGGFPIVDPLGIHSLKIGFDSIHYCTNKARYYVHVPVGVNDYALIYHYAIVMQDPGHIPSQQPKFTVTSIDSATGNLIPCGNFSYVAGALPGFAQSQQDTSVHYKAWSTASLNLSGYPGHTIIVEFESVDCALSGHWGYGYVDMTCARFEVTMTQCSNSGHITLSAPPGFQNYQWVDSSYSVTIASGDTINILAPATSTTYHVICTPFNGFGCPDTLTARVRISNLALLQHMKDTSICPNTDVQLLSAISGGFAPLTYLWSPSATLNCDTCTDPIAHPISSTTYRLTVTDSSGCTIQDTVRINIIPKLPETVGPGAAYCPGGSALLFAQGGTNYLWLPAYGLDNNHIAGPIAKPDTSTMYTLVIQQGACFVDTYYVNITVYPQPAVQVGPGQTIVAGTSVALQASVQNAVSYEWSASPDLSCTNCLNPIALPQKKTTYTITATGIGGCLAVADVTIDLKCVTDQVFLPNTFTPNADGVNDRFYPSGKGITAIKTFRVYDRWGELLYDGGNIPMNDPNFGWDGTYMNKQLKPDVYVYFLSALCETGETIELKGDISLVR